MGEPKSQYNLTVDMYSERYSNRYQLCIPLFKGKRVEGHSSALLEEMPNSIVRLSYNGSVKPYILIRIDQKVVDRIISNYNFIPMFPNGRKGFRIDVAHYTNETVRMIKQYEPYIVSFRNIASSIFLDDDYPELLL